MKKLERRLELPAVVAISLSSMLGSGIFVLPGIASAKSGPSIWLAYMMAALCVLPAALSKAELAAAMPTSGGTYVYLDRAFGPLAGTVAGLGLWFSLLLKCAFALVGLGVYLAVISDILITPVALGLVACIVVLNIRGVRGVSQVQFMVTAICVTLLIGLMVMGGMNFDASRLEPLFPNGASGFLNATAFVFVSFAGVTKVAAIAEEIRRPERNLPLGIMLSLGLVTLIYAGIALVLVGCTPAAALAVDLRPIHSLAQALGGPLLGIPTAIVGAATLASMANAGVLAASRFPFAMSRDDLLPPILGRLHSRYLTPTTSIILSGIVIASAIAMLDVERLAKLASAFMIMIYCSENIAVIALRETHVQWYTPRFRSPFYPATQVVGVLATIGLLGIMGGVAVAAGAAIALAGVVLYLSYGRKRANRMGVLLQRGPRRDLLQSVSTSIKTLAEPTLSIEAAVVVALVGKERSPEMLVELAEALCEGGRLEVVHLTEIPEQTGLDALGEDPLLKSIQRRIGAMAETREIPLEFEALVSRDIVKTIDEISSRLHSHWLVMEWTGRDQGSFTTRNPLGWLRDHVSCNLAVFHDAGVRYIREILVHVEPNNHDALVADTANYLATVHGAKLTFIRFVPNSAPMTHAQREADYLDQIMSLCTSPSEALIVRGPSKNVAIGEASAAYDLLVTAQVPRRTIWGMIRGTAPERLTEISAACSVLRLQGAQARSPETVNIHKARAQLRDLDLRDYLDKGCVGIQVDAVSKEDLFDTIAKTFAAALSPLESSEIAAALWDRERVQNTAVGMGLALPHATLADAGPTPHLGIITTTRPVDYDAPDGRGVDVFFVTLSSPETRLSHLVVMSAISKMVLETPLLERLRTATGEKQVLTAVAECSAEGYRLPRL